MKLLKEQLLTDPHLSAWYVVKCESKDRTWNKVRRPLMQRVTFQLLYQIQHTLN